MRDPRVSGNGLQDSDLPIRRRLVGAVLFVVGAAILVGGIWIAVTGLLARSQLQVARSDIDQLRYQLSRGRLAEARDTAADIEMRARRAHALTTGPAWTVASAVPAGGQPFRSVRELTEQADELGHRVLPALVATSRQLDPSTIRAPDGQIRVDRLAAALPALDTARSAISSVTTAVQDAPSHTWLPQVDAARRALLDQLHELGSTVSTADQAARIAPPMLGLHGTKRYFLAFQNEAEARGTGGVPGAFAIVRVSDGRIRFERFESDSFLDTQPTGLDFGHDYAQLLAGARSTSYYPNTDITPQFSYAARIWIAMWQRRTGERLDGALAVDPTAISYLLRATGPARLPGGREVTAANAVALTQQTVYAKFPRLGEQVRRKKYLLRVARAVGQKVVLSGASSTSLLRAAGEAAGQRRVLVYSTDPSTEQALERTSLGGQIPRTSRPYVGLAVVNVGGNKLDYYLHRQLSWDRTGCGATRQVTVTVRLINAAPAHGLSPYVTARHDYYGRPTRPGDNRLAVYYYATTGARLAALDIDGRAAPPSVGALAGHPVFVADVEMPRGRTRVVVFHLTEPAAPGAPLVLRQPLVHGLGVSLHDDVCR